MPTWTTDQRKVIDTRNNNILVSAAAGSGKTAVLVERIISKIINDKTEVDNLLVVTFTNAAAKEMKERIRNALSSAIENNPKSEFLERQNTLIANANISTIDSFCGRLVRENFNDIGIDPSFRICDASEESILLQEAIDKVLDKNFSSDNNEEFLKLVSLYTKTSDYSVINDVITGLLRRAFSYPWPKEWLNDIKKPYMVNEDDGINDIFWIVEMYNSYINELNQIKGELCDFLLEIEPHIVLDKKGNNKAKTYIEQGITYIDILLDTSDIEELYMKISDVKKMSKGKATFVKSFDVDYESETAEELFTSYDSLSSSYNDLFSEIKNNRVDDILEECSYVSSFALTLITITEEVMDVFDELKADNNAYTFNDVERFALNILVDPETKKITDTGLEFQKSFNEVMVDEYQDINDLQEKILATISNGSNMFMVGDVKQSIYGFRMAKPEIFVGKCDIYNEDESKGVLINLKKNFRSRREVLDAVNDVFLHVMTRDTCNIEYDDNAKLYFGAEKTYSDSTDADVEILIADSDYGKCSDNDEDIEESVEAFETTRKLEATIVAERIRGLIDSHYQITEKVSDEVIKRDIRYSDIAIILRGANTNGREYEEVLLDHNIPCLSPNSKGYFNTIEVKLMLAFLSVIDNPFKDIELTAILHSPIFDISNDMLAKIKIYNRENKDVEHKNYYLYYAIEDYINFFTDNNEEKNDEEFDRLVYAFDMIRKLREIVADTPIHELLEIIYERTSYLDYVSALFNGQYKRANLLALIDKAIDFEKTRFKGVFRFLKYIETMEEFDIDLGEASISSENDDVVKILTMHKSKGLEFPVVFVSDLGNKIDNIDLKKSILIHNSLGIGMELRREVAGNKYKKDTQYKNYIKNALKKDYMGEEARLLYVAMTRAKEKLILTAALKKPEEKTKDYCKGNMNYMRMMNAKSRIEWVIRGIASTNCESLNSMIRFVSPTEQAIKDVVEFTYINDRKEQFNNMLMSYPKDLSDKIENRLSFTYPYVINNDIKTKYSVSEIKHKAMEKAFDEELSDEEQLEKGLLETPEFLGEEKEKIIPEFISNKKTEEVNRGALYGTAMHRVLECYDFLDSDYNKSLSSQIESMRNAKLITTEQNELINIEKLQRFLESDVASRMHKASELDNLWIEQPFVLEEEPKNLFEVAGEELDPIIVQGIIDVFFIEDDQIVLLDYKTDKISTPDELIIRYKAQIELYAKALEKSFHKKVKEKILYSFSLEKSISL